MLLLSAAGAGDRYPRLIESGEAPFFPPKTRGKSAMKEILMPKTSKATEEGAVVRWSRKEGEQVKKGEVLLEVDTDKVTMGKISG